MRRINISSATTAAFQQFRKRFEEAHDVETLVKKSEVFLVLGYYLLLTAKAATHAMPS